MASAKNQPNALTVILPEDAQTFVEILHIAVGTRTNCPNYCYTISTAPKVMTSYSIKLHRIIVIYCE